MHFSNRSCMQQHSARKFIANFTNAIGFRFGMHINSATDAYIRSIDTCSLHLCSLRRMHTANFNAKFPHSLRDEEACVCGHRMENANVCIGTPFARMQRRCGFINIVYIRNFQIFITFASRSLRIKNTRKYTRRVHVWEANGK